MALSLRPVSHHHAHDKSAVRCGPYLDLKRQTSNGREHKLRCPVDVSIQRSTMKA